jgi:hypothetical protein
VIVGLARERLEPPPPHVPVPPWMTRFVPDSRHHDLVHPSREIAMPYDRILRRKAQAEFRGDATS